MFSAERAYWSCGCRIEVRPLLRLWEHFSHGRIADRYPQVHCAVARVRHPSQRLQAARNFRYALLCLQQRVWMLWEVSLPSGPCLLLVWVFLSQLQHLQGRPLSAVALRARLLGLLLLPSHLHSHLPRVPLLHHFLRAPTRLLYCLLLRVMIRLFLQRL